MQKALEKRLLQFPEVKEVFTRLGTSEIASEPLNRPALGTAMWMLKPRSAWPDPNLPKNEFERRISAGRSENFQARTTTFHNPSKCVSMN